MPATRKLFTITLLGLTAAGAAFTIAHAESRYGHDHTYFKSRAPMMLGADANGDGAIDATEWSALFTKLDANGDGKIETAELPFHRGELPPEALAYFIARQADTDKDGKVTRAEWDARVAALDTDHDGAISPAELKLRHPSSESSDTLPPFLAHWDSNDDGKLQASELDSLFTAADRDGDGVLTRFHDRDRDDDNQRR